MNKLHTDCRYYVEGDRDCGPSCKIDRKFIEHNNWSCNGCNKFRSKKITNQDWLVETVFKTMNPEKLAHIIEDFDIFRCDRNCPVDCKFGNTLGCVENVKQWLKESYKEEQ